MPVSVVHGRVCARCKSTVRYENSGQCVVCSKRRVKENIEKTRKKTRRSWSGTQGMPVPDKPSQKNWSKFVDPIVHFGMGDEGKFE